MKRNSNSMYSYVLNLPKEYEKKIKEFCLNNSISIKNFIKIAIDSKLKEGSKENE